MNKEALVYQAETVLRQLAENNFKLLFSTHNFQLMGIVTWDRKELDEPSGVKRRMIKGLRIGNGVPLAPEEMLFETSLHRKNPMSGQLDDIVVHEDDKIILMERKSFELSDDEDNFQFMVNMNWLNKTQQLLDEIEANYRRINRLNEEKDETMLDVEHFKREAQAAREKQKTQTEMLNRLTRNNAVLQERIGNLEAAYYQSRARNLKYEAMMDETIANATEEGTVIAMTSDDRILHAAQKKGELYQAMHEIEPESLGITDTLQIIMEEIEEIKQTIKPQATGIKTPEKPKQTGETTS